MLDVSLDLPLDLKRICQASAKVYLVDRKEFGVVTEFSDRVVVRLDQGKSSASEIYTKDEFIDKLQADIIVAKGRVVLPDGDSGNMKIKPRPKTELELPKTLAQPQTTGQYLPQPQILTAPQSSPQVENLLTGYIDENSGKFSSTLQKGMIEIQYKKVTRKVALELDSVQLQKLKDMGIIDD